MKRNQLLTNFIGHTLGSLKALCQDISSCIKHTSIVFVINCFIILNIYHLSTRVPYKQFGLHTSSLLIRCDGQ